MGVRSAARLGPSVLAAVLADRRRPLFVGWSLTDACNADCGYCGRPTRGLDGFDRARALALAEEMVDAGVHQVSLTGGEPLVHPDLAALADRLAGGDVRVNLNTNGALLPDHVGRLRDSLSSVTVSLDGGRSEHDALRGAGSWQRAVHGARAARTVGLPVDLHAVITAHNAGAVGELLDLAGTLDGKVGFSVLERVPAMGHKDLVDLIPSPSQWRRVVDELLQRKRSGDRRILNSSAGLRYLRHWPDHAPIRCSAGKVYARIEPDGRMYGCGNLVSAGEGVDLTRRSFADAFAALPRRACEACWCDTRVEMNLVLAWRPSALRAAWGR